MKKKEDNVTAVDKVADMVEGQSADIDVQLQANEELVMDGSDYKNVADEDETYDLPHQLEDTLEAGSNKKTFCRKRKALKTPHSSKYLTPIAVIQKLKNCQVILFFIHKPHFWIKHHALEGT